MMTEQERELIAEYEYLRKCSICLFRKWSEIDERMLEIESQLPDSYTFPGDPPLDMDEDETQDG